MVFYTSFKNIFQVGVVVYFSLKNTIVKSVH